MVTSLYTSKFLAASGNKKNRCLVAEFSCT